MENFQLIDRDIDVRPALGEIMAQPELWNQHTQRKTAPGSPHSEMSDIWLRYRRFDELTDAKSYLEPHIAEFYPAWEKLPGVKDIVHRLMVKTDPVYLGGILITKIPPGGKIAPHHDRGGWHAEFHNLKLYVPLQSNEGCINICEGEREVMRAGEAWTFDNLRVHSVENNGDEDRITLIISMRVA